MFDPVGRLRRSKLAAKRNLTAGDREGFGRACRLLPRVEAMVQDFDLGPWFRIEEVGFRSYALKPRLLAPCASRELRFVICDAEGANEADGLDLQTITITHLVGKESTRIVVKETPGLLWTLMSAREIVGHIGNFAALALSVLRSHVKGAGIVSEVNARDASRYASLCFNAAEDPSQYIDVWKVEPTDSVLVITPIIEAAQSLTVSPIDMLRYSGAYHQVAAAERALKHA